MRCRSAARSALDILVSVPGFSSSGSSSPPRSPGVNETRYHTHDVSVWFWAAMSPLLECKG